MGGITGYSCPSMSSTRRPTSRSWRSALLRDSIPTLHIAFGRALAPIREQNVLILGSGMSTHDLSGRLTGEQADAFDTWLEDTMMSPANERDAQLARWSEAPGGRAAHPREEHLLPLMVVAGAGRDDAVTRSMKGTAMGFPIAGYQFS